MGICTFTYNPMWLQCNVIFMGKFLTDVQMILIQFIPDSMVKYCGGCGK